MQKKEKIKITEMSIPFKGEIVQTDTADSGEIVILSDNTLKLNDILGDEKLLPRKAWTDNPLPLLRTTKQSKGKCCWMPLQRLRILIRFCAL